MKTTITLSDAVGLVAICFGWMIWQSSAAFIEGLSADAGNVVDGFTNASLLGLVAIELLLGSLALLYLQVRQFEVRSLLARPTWRGSVQGLALYAVMFVVASLLLSLFSSVDMDLEPIQQMVDQSTASLPVIVLVSIVNGTYEEVFLLGVLVRGLRGYGLALAWGLSLAVRLLCHTYQGPLGMLSVLVFGVLVTAYFTKTNRLWPVVFCHMLADAVPLALY